MDREYGPKARKKIKQVMHEFGQGQLKSSSGHKVANRDQAVAIGISKAKEAGYKVPNPPMPRTLLRRQHKG